MILSLFNSFCSRIILSSTIEAWWEVWRLLLHWVEWWRFYHQMMKYLLMGVLRKEFPVIVIKSFKMHSTKFYTTLFFFTKWQPHYSFKELFFIFVFFFFFFFFTNITALKYFKGPETMYLTVKCKTCSICQPTTTKSS